MPANDAPIELSFALSIRLETASEPWRAALSPAVGPRLEFASPLDLLRHLAQLAPCHSAPGGLR
ncbi:MAG: hypothetical protein ABIQ33_07550 [Caldimonas sp.]